MAQATDEARQRMAGGTDAPPVLLHLHVPKCAGSSVNHVLARRLGARMLGGTPQEIWSRLRAAERQENDAAFDAVGGHFTWGIHQRFSRPFVYFSIVRDPVDRICSFFNFIHAAPHHPLHETFRQSLTSLDDLTEDFLARHPDLCAAWSNYMAFAWTGVPAGTEDYRRTVRQRVARQIRLGRLVLGEVEGIEALLRRHAVLRPGETLPRRNVRDDGAGDHLMASPDRLRPQVRALLEARNREDIHLLHFLRKRDLLARPEPVARREETSPTPHRPGA